MKARSLRWRISWGLLAYTALLTGALVSAAAVLGEKRERAVWRAILTDVIEHDAHVTGLLEAQGGVDAPIRLIDLDSPAAATLPEALRRLKAGLHQRLSESGHPYAVLVEVQQGHRLAAMIDITGHERAERRLFGGIVAIATAAILGLLAAAWWLAGQLVRPVAELGARLHALDPMRRGERIHTSYRQAEIVTIEAAVNAFLERLDAFVVREREFIDTVSHELRTPITVISGAADVLDDIVVRGAPGRPALDRIHATVVGITETVTALLYLAKDPTAFAEGEPFRLDRLLPELVREHELLLAGRDVEIQVQRLEPTEIVAPARVAAVAIGNLLRNAIEHTPKGIICVSLAGGVVEILDAGSEVDAATISRLYRAQVTGTRTAGAGIGLYVIGRICERLGWRLSFETGVDGGTRVRLDISTSRSTASIMQ